MLIYGIIFLFCAAVAVVFPESLKRFVLFWSFLFKPIMIFRQNRCSNFRELLFPVLDFL